MNPIQPKKTLNAQILEEAAEWFVEFASGDIDPVAKQRFGEWLRASPEHVRAYLELLPIWQDGALPPSTHEPNPDRLIAWAQRSPDNVISLGHFSTPQLSGTRHRKRLAW